MDNGARQHAAAAGSRPYDAAGSRRYDTAGHGDYIDGEVIDVTEVDPPALPLRPE